MNQTQKFRQLVISLLDTQDGISSEAYKLLQEYVDLFDPHSCDDIWNAVEAAGQVFLPEDHGLLP